MSMMAAIPCLALVGFGPLLADGNALWQFFAQIGDVLALGLAAAGPFVERFQGSALGIGLAGQAAVGAWAKEARSGRPLNFTYIILLGMPLSQTLYGMIVMLNMRNVLNHAELTVDNAGLLLGIGIATGIAELFSAWMQGLIGAAGVRCLSDGQGKGFAFVIIAMGIAETVGIFAMIFLLMMIPAVPVVAG